jgi:hypothetical protein
VSDEAGADWLTADLGIGEDAMPLETDRGLHSNGSVQWTVGPGLSHLDGMELMWKCLALPELEDTY